MPKQLDLFCGQTPRQREGYEIFGVDIMDFGLPNIKIADLTFDKIPFDNDEFDLITIHDGVEHLPDLIYINSAVEKYSTEGILSSHIENVRALRRPVIELFNECYRILRHDGRLWVSVPKFPTWAAIADPTHVASYWVPERVNYFSGDYFGSARIYAGHTSRFEQIKIYEGDPTPYHLNFELRAIKNVPTDHPYLLKY